MRISAGNRYLYIGIAASVLLHAGVLALRFQAPQSDTAVRDIGLEVVLLNARSDERPKDPQVLAQVDMEGGGAEDAGVARSPLPPTPASTTVIPLDVQHARQQQLEAQQRELLVRLRALQAAAQGVSGEAGEADRALAGVRPDHAPAQPTLAQQVAAISERIEDYNRQPRRHFFAPSASSWVYAEYVEQWRNRVEDFGNAHYPDGARGRYYGSLRMTVFVRTDGSVEKIEFDQPSAHAILNQAARDIVLKAAPFPPFPEAVRRDTDIIAITRTWHFQNDALSTEISP